MNARNHEADQWQDFHSKFMQLAVEEAKIVRAEGRYYLQTAFTYGVSLPVKGESGQGPFCPFPAPEFGLWRLGSMNENFQERFRTLATRAGAALGSLQGTDPLNFWLHRLFLYLRERYSEELLVPKGGELWTPEKGGRGKELLGATQEGVIRRVCLTSATFCSWLERQALEQSEPVAGGSFTHSNDYRSVTLSGIPFSLTSRQAQVIGILHEHHENGTPDVGTDHILVELGSKNSRLRDTFRTNQTAWKTLIRQGGKRGTVRLNL